MTRLLAPDLAAGELTFTATHTYTSSGNFTIAITGTDNDSGRTSANVRIAVNPLPTPPLAPRGLTATTISATQINLAWTDVSDNENGFKIERCIPKGRTCDFVEIAQTGANTVSFSNTGLSKNTTYNYRVRAFNGAGDSPYSNTASTKTPSR